MMIFSPAVDGMRGKSDIGALVKKIATTTCYLCGKPLSPPMNADHPVMRQLFAPEIRRARRLTQLIILDVHEACNTAYQPDEDYFVHSLMPFARGLRRW